jgi:uncharacterized repeat protein (TIGR01451 family)
MAIFTNQATLSYRNGVVTSNVVTGEIVEVLTADKNALIDNYGVGDTLTYVINIINSGNAAVDNVEVTDDLGAYEFGTSTLVPLSYVERSVAYYSNGVLQPDPAVTSGPSLIISGITVPANGSAVLIYQASVNEFAPLGEGGEITNTAEIKGACICNDVVVTETVRVSERPLLGISKAISPTTVTENGQVTYTFTVQNFGNTDAVATDDLVLTDTFDPALSRIIVTYNGDVWTEGDQYNYNEETGEFSTVASNITVPAATFTQDSETGEWNVIPGVSIVTVVGKITCES